ncbi:hypothetical protein Bbelb_358680 [Branchiostoma belcheri]|nr:hypothetical protein Bbelb_358680 [Branchiostoma belcheri]
MDSVIMASARRWCRKLHYSGGSRVLFLLTLLLAVGFVVRNYWQVKDDSETRKAISNVGDKKFAQSIQELLAQGIDEKRMREALRHKAEEVHRIVKERGEALAKEAQAKANVIKINIHNPKANPKLQHTWKAAENAAHDEIQDAQVRPEQYLTFKRLMEAKKCPACFGESLCEQADVGIITVDIADKTLEHKGVYFGHLKDTDVVAKRLAEKDGWMRFDEFICQNASMPKDCDVSDMISKTVLVTDDVLQVPWLQGAWQIAHTRRSVAMEACMTSKLAELIQTVFDENENKKLSKTERSYMLTALLINAEAALLKYFTKSETDWPFPKYLGACGRVIFVESGGKLLDSSLESPWKERANIALQLLDMIDNFRNSDPNWMVIFFDFRYDNFAVNDYGRLSLIDFDDVMLLDREESIVEELTEPRNFEHFKAFRAQVEGYIVNNNDFCSDIPQYSQMMYAVACVRLLSYLPEHLSQANPMDPEPHKHRPPEGHVKPPGLLWGPPEQEAKVLEPLLRGCVDESVAGGRLEAVEKLRAVLRKSVKREN